MGIDRKNDGALIAVIVIACFLALYNTTAMTVALPAFVKQFHASVTLVQWLMIGYTVIMGVASPLASWFVHRFSLRNYFMYSMIGFAILSFFSGASNNIYFMIFIRSIQGLMGAALVPVTMIAIYRFIPRNRQPFFLTIQNMSLSLGPAIGPVIAGLLLTAVSWRWLFWFNVPFSILAAFLARKILPKEQASSSEKVDILSIAAIVIGCLLVLLSFSLATHFGLLSPIILTMLTSGSVLCGVFVYRQNTLERPILTFAMMKDREYRLSLIVNALLSMSLCLAPFVLAIYFQTVRGYSAFIYGLFLLIPAIFSVGGAPVSQRLYHFLTSKILILIGLGLLTIGNLALGAVTITSSLVYVIGFLCIRYLGIGILGMPITDHGMRVLPPQQTDDGATLINWIKLMASSLSLSVFTMVYTMVVNNAMAKGANEILAEVQGVDAVFISSGILLIIGLFIGMTLKKEAPTN